MITRPTRKDKNGRTILEEINELPIIEYLSDTFALEEDFSDMQMLICDILAKLPDTPLNYTEISCIGTLEQACITILEKINTKLQ